MKKNIIPLLVLAIPFIYFCCDSSSDLDLSTEKNQAIEAAKSFIINNGNVLSLPIQPSNVATRSVSYPTDATPIWEQARIEMYKDEQVVIVPLEGQEEIRSRAVITKGNEKIYLFSKTFSRLIVRTRGESSIAHIVTYLPESNYAETHAAALASMGFSAQKANFTGVIIISSLNGNMIRTFIYSEGNITNRMLPIVKHIHTEDCTHEHHDGDELSIYLYSSTENNILTRDAGDDGAEYDLCPYCAQHKIYCKCTNWKDDPNWGWGDDSKEGEGDDKDPNKDDKEDDINPDACYRCNKYPCVCNYTVCLICGENPCLCYFDTEYCTKCKKETCVCKDESKEDPEK